MPYSLIKAWGVSSISGTSCLVQKIPLQRPIDPLHSIVALSGYLEVVEAQKAQAKPKLRCIASNLASLDVTVVV